MTRKITLTLTIAAISITAILGSLIPSHAAQQQNSPWTSDITNLQTLLQNQINTVTGNISTLTSNLNNEISSRQSTDAALSSQINNLNSLITNPPPAPINKFLFVKSVKQGDLGGSSTDPNHQSAIGIISVGHSIVSPTDLATGQASGKRQHSPLVIVTHIDKATPKLYQALVTDENLPNVELDYWKTNSDGSQNMYFTIKLTNARISSINFTNQNSADHPSSDTFGEYVEISFTYQKIEWTWTDGGITAQDDWTALP